MLVEVVGVFGALLDQLHHLPRVWIQIHGISGVWSSKSKTIVPVKVVSFLCLVMTI